MGLFKISDSLRWRVGCRGEIWVLCVSERRQERTRFLTITYGKHASPATTDVFPRLNHVSEGQQLQFAVGTEAHRDYRSSIGNGRWKSEGTPEQDMLDCP